MMQMVTDDPLSGNWTDKGVYFKNPGTFKNRDGKYYPTGANHARLQKFGSNYYLIYQTQWLENKLGISAGYRNVSINKASVSESSNKIMTSTANDMGVSQLSGVCVNPFVSNPASMMANGAGVELADSLDTPQTSDLALIPKNGGWIYVKGVQFGQEEAKKFSVLAKGSGVIDVRVDNITDEPVCSLPFDCDEPQTFDVVLENAMTGLHNLYLSFSQVDSASVYSWHFGNATAIKGLYQGENEDKTAFDLQGRKLPSSSSVSKSGIIIKKGKKLIIK